MPPWVTDRWGVLAILALMGAKPAVAVTAPAEAGASIPLRVATIGYRLASAGVDRCPRRAPLTGLLLHDLAAYDQRVRPSVAQQFGLTSGMGVLEVVPESPAHQAQITAGDEIIALAGVAMAALRLPPTTKDASYDRVEAFTQLLGDALARGPVKLTLRRAARTRIVVVEQHIGCAARFAVLPGETPAAWSDGSYAAVNQGLARVAGDDELAFALAHEMSHVVLGHAETKRPILAGLGIAGGQTREREREADRLGTLIALDGGFAAVNGADAFLERLVRAHGRLSLTHPSIASRLADIRGIAAGAARSQAGSSL